MGQSNIKTKTKTEIKTTISDQNLQTITLALKDKFIIDPDNDTKIKIESLWQKHKGPTIIELFRRWGCAICRLGAIELSELKMTLDTKYGPNAIKLYGIGFEKIGLEEFKKGKYFIGKVYIDENRLSYKALNYKSKCSITGGTLWQCGMIYRAKKANSRKIKWNFQGDGFQLGGTIVVTSDGIVLYHKPQKFYGDDPKPQELEILFANYFKELEIPERKNFI